MLYGGACDDDDEEEIGARASSLGSQAAVFGVPLLRSNRTFRGQDLVFIPLALVFFYVTFPSANVPYFVYAAYKFRGQRWSREGSRPLPNFQFS